MVVGVKGESGKRGRKKNKTLDILGYKKSVRRNVGPIFKFGHQ